MGTDSRQIVFQKLLGLESLEECFYQNCGNLDVPVNTNVRLNGARKLLYLRSLKINESHAWSAAWIMALTLLRSTAKSSSIFDCYREITMRTDRHSASME